MVEENLQMKIKYEENKELRYAVLIIGGLLSLILTLLFRLEGYAYNFTSENFEKIIGAVDLTITSAFYDNGTWIHEDYFLWDFFNENDRPLLLSLIVISFIMLLAGLIGKNDFKKKIWMRYGWFIILSTALVAGLVVNVIFKGMWGRWRPRQTIFFGGTEPFYPVWEPAWAIQPESIDEGVSFPSGHPSSLTSYIALFFVFNHPELIAHLLGEFKNWKLKLCKIIKWTSLSIAMLGGILMGVARVVVGAHFASDVMWNLIFTYFLTALIYYVIFRWTKVEKELVEKINNEIKK